MPHTASSVLPSSRQGSLEAEPETRMRVHRIYFGKKGGREARGVKGRNRARTRSAEVQAQPDPTGALKHELHQRTGLTLKQEGRLFVPLCHSAIGNGGRMGSSYLCGKEPPFGLGQASRERGSSESLAANIHNSQELNKECTSPERGSRQAPKAPHCPHCQVHLQ